MQKNVAGQYWWCYAYDLTDGTAKTGDAANITADLSIDGLPQYNIGGQRSPHQEERQTEQ